MPRHLNLLLALAYLSLSGFFGWLFYVRYWQWRECITEAASSCITPDGASLISGGSLWIVVSLAFAIAFIRRLMRWRRARQTVAAER